MVNDEQERVDERDDATLAKLMQLAGERPEVSINVESRVYSRVHEEWRRSTSSSDDGKAYAKVRQAWRWQGLRRNLLLWAVPVAISAVAAVSIFFSPQPEPVSVPAVASISKVVGAASPYDEGGLIQAGDVITTGENEGLALVLARNESLRIDANTELRVDSADEFTLLSGRIYADTGEFIYRNSGLEIHTSFGVVSDVGTQFAVLVSAQSVDVGVREGRVDLQSNGDTHTARMGERLTLVQGKGASVTELDTHDIYWNWATDLAPVFDVENRSLLDFLKWVARETGRELQFESDESRIFAMRTDIFGSVAGLTPDQALEAIMATTTVHYAIESDKIVVGR